MTAKQFARALEHLELSQLGAARMLGYDGRTARKWIAGERGIPPAVGKLLNLALAGRITVAEIEQTQG
jgi:hypothetical protein